MNRTKGFWANSFRNGIGVTTRFRQGAGCLLIVAILPACAKTQPPPPTPEQLLHKIELQEQKMGSVFEQVPDTGIVYPYVRLVEQLAEQQPDNPAVPDLLVKAAGLANGTNWSNKSIQLWGYLWRRYPDHPKAPEAMFYQAYVMDNQYADYDLAVQYYDAFLSAHPNHELAASARELRSIALKGGKLPPVPASPHN